MCPDPISWQDYCDVLLSHLKLSHIISKTPKMLFSISADISLSRRLIAAPWSLQIIYNIPKMSHLPEFSFCRVRLSTSKKWQKNTVQLYKSTLNVTKGACNGLKALFRSGNTDLAQSLTGKGCQDRVTELKLQLHSPRQSSAHFNTLPYILNYG